MEATSKLNELFEELGRDIANDSLHSETSSLTKHHKWKLAEDMQTDNTVNVRRVDTCCLVDAARSVAMLLTILACIFSYLPSYPIEAFCKLQQKREHHSRDVYRACVGYAGSHTTGTCNHYDLRSR